MDKTVVVWCGVSIFAVVSGCSSSSSPTSGTGGATATTSSSGWGQGGASSSSSSTSTSSSSSTSSTSSSSGAGGAGSCEACVTQMNVFGAGNCKSADDACKADVDCSAWLMCTTNCTSMNWTPECFAACDQAESAVMNLFQPLKDCACGVCLNVCGNACN
jgi:hypothetical protein